MTDRKKIDTHRSTVSTNRRRVDQRNKCVQFEFNNIHIHCIRQMILSGDGLPT